MSNLSLIFKIVRNFFFFLPGHLIAQQVQTNMNIDPYLYLTSPQIYDFVSYGNQQISHYIGQTKVTIPIHTYQDYNFEIPIFLSYNSAGFMPNKHESIVGLNWALNAGGAIIRKVNGVPDDKDGVGEINYLPSMAGWYVGIKTGKIANAPDALFKLQINSDEELYKGHINHVETQPDEFMFSAPGIQGSFYIGMNGQVKCSDNKPYKVYINLPIQPYQGFAINTSSSFIIIADNGYQYYFGGDLNSLEISYKYDDPNKSDKYKYPNMPNAAITGWHLTKIIAPNAKTIYYTYEECPNNTEPNQKVYPYVENKYYVNNSYVSHTTVIPYSISPLISEDRTEMLTEIIKPAYLKKIQIDNTIISFGYKNITENAIMSTQLHGIKVSYKDNIIDDISLTYQKFGKSFNRFFLTDVQHKGQPPYKLTYYNIADFPNRLTKGIDHWGFWNGKDNNSKLIENADRKPNFNFSMTGMLDIIQYPTGGYSKFYYEEHNYSALLKRDFINNRFLPVLSASTGTAGGVRIKKIEDSDGNNIFNITEYEYLKNNGSQSSGILMNYPQYSFSWCYNYRDNILDYSVSPPELVTIFYQVQGYALSSESFHINTYLLENYIHYSEVKEIHRPNGGYTIYEFNNYESSPDIAEFYLKYTPSLLIPVHPTLMNFCSFADLFYYSGTPGIFLNSRHLERGLIKRLCTYTENGYPIEEKLFEYTGLIDYPNLWMAGIINTGILAASYKIYHYPVLSKKETVTQYLNGKPYTTTTNYEYDMQRQNGYLKKQTTTGSNGILEEITYNYVYDILRRNKINTNAYQWLNDNNIHNMPIEKLQYKNGKLSSASFSFYNSFPITATRTVYPATLLTLETTGSIYNYNTGSIDDRLTPEVQYDRYDDVGNILQLRKTDNIPILFLWSYNKHYPVAEAKGITYEALTQILGENEIKNIADNYFSDEQLREKLQTLRERLPHAMITSYTYRPLVGMTSQTDPNGITTYYEYDEFNRLKIVRDHEGNVLYQYEYHYHQNE
jgi:YD repeat-containing protein